MNEITPAERDHWITQARRIAAQRDEFESEKDGAWAEVERLTAERDGHSPGETCDEADERADGWARLAGQYLIRAETAEAERDEANRARYLAEQDRDDALARAEAAEERVDGQAWEDITTEVQQLREGIAAALEPCGCRWERCSCVDDDLRALLGPSDGGEA